MMNISIITIIMLTMVIIGGIANVNAITHNSTITNEDGGSIDKSKFAWGLVNRPEPGSTPPPTSEDANNNEVQPKTSSPLYKE